MALKIHGVRFKEKRGDGIMGIVIGIIILIIVYCTFLVQNIGELFSKIGIKNEE